MSLSPIGSAVFELLSHKHTDIQTDIQISYYFRVRIDDRSETGNIEIRHLILIQYI